MVKIDKVHNQYGDTVGIEICVDGQVYSVQAGKNRLPGIRSGRIVPGLTDDFIYQEILKMQLSGNFEPF